MNSILKATTAPNAALTTVGYNQITLAEAGNPYLDYGNASGAIEGDLLKFSKFGEWHAGQDSKKIALGTRLVARMETLAIGWLRWSDGKPVEKRLGFLGEGFAPPPRDQLGDRDETLWPVGPDGKATDPWQFINSLVLIDPATDQVYTFQIGSRGGINAIGAVCRAYGRRMRSHPGDLPIVELGSSSYRHAQFGEIRIPQLNVVGWTNGNTDAPAIAGPNPPPFSDGDCGPAPEDIIAF